uniref:ATP-binding protein n=1 Tax=Vulcanisaeta sp. JCM 14467 TaxID=1295370 RepID=UPI000A7232B6
MVDVGVEDIRRRLLELLREATDEAWVRAVWAVIDLARELIKVRRDKLAVLIDDAFQAIGLDKAAIYVKGLLGLIEYPPEHYERIIAVAATSEGISKREIGRHRWATLLTIWNMTKDGFKQLYEQLPGNKPDFDIIWRVTGGNPWVLSILLKNHWNVDDAITELIRSKGLGEAIQSLSKGDRELLARAVDDPDMLMSRDGIPLMNRLIELNLIVDNIYPRGKKTVD